MLVDQLLTSVKYINSKNLIHRDINPANFVIELDMRELNKVYIIDFGQAKSHYDTNTWQHIIWLSADLLLELTLMLQ